MTTVFKLQTSRCSNKPVRLWLAALAVALTMASVPVYAAGTILVFGDSLSAGYGLARADGWVALLDARLTDRDADMTIVNASVSGETTAGGRARFDAALDRTDPDIVILELGGNDGLRALPVADMKANLAAMIDAARDADSSVLLLGMRIPANYGKRYSEQFHSAFNEIAKDKDVAYVPFFLEPVADDRSNFQDDGIHPNAAAQPAMLDAVWPTLAPLVDGLSQSPTGS